MKGIAIIVLIAGVVALILAVVSKLIGPIWSSLPSSIMNFANSCFLLAIALLLLEKK